MVKMAVGVERLREVCERYGVVRLDVFGSATARGTTTADSDVDLLYTLVPGARLGCDDARLKFPGSAH